jgi:mycoredoxin
MDPRATTYRRDMRTSVRPLTRKDEGIARMKQPVTMYTTVWCGYCRRLERQMTEAGITFRKVDIDAHRRFGDRIEAATGGHRIVPTIEVEGELLVNPSIAQVSAAVGGATTGN